MGRLRYLFRAFFHFYPALGVLGLATVGAQDASTWPRALLFASVLVVLGLVEFWAAIQLPETRSGLRLREAARVGPGADVALAFVRGFVGAQVYVGAAYLAVTGPAPQGLLLFVLSFPVLLIGRWIGFSEARLYWWPARRLVIQTGLLVPGFLDVSKASAVSLHITEYRRPGHTAVSSRQFRAVALVGSGKPFTLTPEGWMSTGASGGSSSKDSEAEAQKLAETLGLPYVRNPAMPTGYGAY